MDAWLAYFSLVGSKPGAFPFTPDTINFIEVRRARMSDLLIFDVLLIRGGIPSPDMLFPPLDWASLKKLLNAIDESVYDILKKDCLIYILLRFAWDLDVKDPNHGWRERYIEERCIPPQFELLADAYWQVDTGICLSNAVCLLSDARLNTDYASKILQSLALSSSSAPLVVKYVRTAKPLLTEPDDIDLYTLSLAQLSFMDAWAYQRSFPEGSDTRERLLQKLVGWCLMPTPKQEPVAQLLEFPLSSYEQSSLHALALPSQLSTSSSIVNSRAAAGPVLSSQAISVLQDLLCVRAIQSGDYIHAIKLDRQFSSISSSLGNGMSSSNITSQTVSSARDAIDRKSIMQDLFATLPPAERTLLEDEIGKVATGVRVNSTLTLMPKQGVFAPARKPLTAEMSSSASWEDVRANTGSPAPSPSVSRLSSAVSVGFSGKATAAPASIASKAGTSAFSTSASPFSSHISRPQPASTRQAPPIPKFTAFGSPIPTITAVGTGRGVITDRGKTLFSTSTTGGSSAAAKPPTHVSLFETAGSAKNAPNAFYRPPPAPVVRESLDVTSALASSSSAKGTGPSASVARQNGNAQGADNDGEDVSMGAGSDVEIIEDEHHEESGGEEQEMEAATDEEEDAGHFITNDKSGAADLTIHMRHVDEMVGEDHAVRPELGFSLFSGGRRVENGSPGGQTKKRVSENDQTPYASPPRAPVSPLREAKTLNVSVSSTPSSKWRAPPGAFHQEEEEEDHYRHDEAKNEGVHEGEDEEDEQASLTTPRRSTRARMPTETPTRPSPRTQPRRRSKATGGTTQPLTRPGRTSSRLSDNQTIPGGLMDDEHDEHGQDHAEHADEDTETDEQEEEDDAIAPLPSRGSRRTRSSGHVGTSTKSKSSVKPSGVAKAATTDAIAKGKAKARPSEVRTPARRSSRLSTASSVSPDHQPVELASPTKKGGRKSSASGPRASTTASGSGPVATRSSSRRKR
ncbi:nuclear pore complex assembly-domain-containing protein [Chiua virens]|nr:nuclear pore complex assembly-domain-containing protein [Chiua virens]